MKRILIIGISGSGKSTLASRLGKKLALPVFHLDKLFFGKGWVQNYSREEFKKVVEDLSDAESWIIDGNYRSSLDKRMERADVIIFLDYPKWRGLWRSFKRVFNRNQPFDKAEGVKERIDWKHVKFVLSYPIQEMRARVSSLKDHKVVYIAKNDRERDAVFEKI